MIIMVYSAFNAASIGGGLGAPEYSYWFVRRAFWPILKEFGIVVPVTDPEQEVDTIVANATARGQACVFVSFEPPHKTILHLRCRTIPVFAWEFDTIPDAPWDGDPRHDWRAVLAATGSAVTHSKFSQAAIRAAMGPNYPVWNIPAPVHDAHAVFAADAIPYHPPADISLSGIAIDSANVDLDVFAQQRGFSEGQEALRALALYLERTDRPAQMLRLSGVIYTAIFNPLDGRKNVGDLVIAFVRAFRATDDAVLLLKITHADPLRGLQPMLATLARLGPFRCRVILIHGMLPDDEYRALLRLTSYTVNTSTNEGQCLPLMEFMSAGRPAIAPRHTAMLDYITEENAFVVRSTERPTIWPHDPRRAIRTKRYIISFADLVRAYRESYLVATQDPARYAAMSNAATASLRAFCADAVVRERLAEIFATHMPACPAVTTPPHPVLIED